MPRVAPERRWLGAHLGLVYLFLYGPIVVLIVLSFNKSGLPTAWTGFSTADLRHSPRSPERRSRWSRLRRVTTVSRPA